MPYPKADLKPAEVARAVLTQYFLPIVRGDLVVEIVHPELGDRTIDAKTIADEIGHIAKSERDDESPQSLRRVVDLARWAVGPEEAAHVELPARNLAQKLATHSDLGELRERYERGERLAFRLTMDARSRRGDAPVLGSFHMYVERDIDLAKGHDYFVRGHLRIPHMDHIERRKARALVLVDGKSELGHMLRDAEGPAHESWDPHAQRLKDNWVGGYQRVQDVRRAPSTCSRGWRNVRPSGRRTRSLTSFRATPRASGKGAVAGAAVEGSLGQSRYRSSQACSRSTHPLERSWYAAPQETKPSSLAPSGQCVSPTTRCAATPFLAFERGVKQRAPDFSLLDGDIHIVSEGCEAEAVDHNAIRLIIASEEFPPHRLRLRRARREGRDA